MIMSEQRARTEHLLHSRPQKCLGCRTPAEVSATGRCVPGDHPCSSVRNMQSRKRKGSVELPLESVRNMMKNAK
jgi:hypothetical protein